MDFIPPEEGVNHLIDELRAGTPESEVLITDGFFQRQFYPYDLSEPGSAGGDRQAHRLAQKQMVTGPLVAEWEPASGGGVARISFDPVDDPFLSQHRLKNKPFLPGVVGVGVACRSGPSPRLAARFAKCATCESPTA